MTHSRPPVRSSVPCCATVVRARGNSLAARLTRRLDELLDSLVAWRCRQHEAWHRRGWPRFPF